MKTEYAGDKGIISWLGCEKEKYAGRAGREENMGCRAGLENKGEERGSAELNDGDGSLVEGV